MDEAALEDFFAAVCALTADHRASFYARKMDESPDSAAADHAEFTYYAARLLASAGGVFTAATLLDPTRAVQEQMADWAMSDPYARMIDASPIVNRARVVGRSPVAKACLDGLLARVEAGELSSEDAAAEWHRLEAGTFIDAAGQA